MIMDAIMAHAIGCGGSGSGGVRKEWQKAINIADMAIPFVVEDGADVGVFQQNGVADLMRVEISNGDICKAIIDGVEYICSAIVEEGVTGIGNLSMLNPEQADNSLPFCIGIICTSPDENKWMIIIAVRGTEATHTVDLYKQVEIMEPSTGGGLTVVELETLIEFTEDVEHTQSLSAADLNNVSEALALGQPFGLKFTTDDGLKYSGVCHVLDFTASCMVFNVEEQLMRVVTVVAVNGQGAAVISIY